MRLSNKKPNRKQTKKKALEVRARERQARFAGFRMVGTALVVSFATVVVLFLAWRTGAWLLDRSLFENRLFAAQFIDIETDGVLSTNEIQSWANFHLGDNLLRLDLSQIKWNLEMIPRIREAEVERVLPNRIHLRVRERVPIARIRAFRTRPEGGVEQVIFLCDAEGFLMRSHRGTAASERTDLPLLRGIRSRELGEGRRLKSGEAHAALEFVTHFNGSPMDGVVTIDLVEATSPEMLVVKTAESSRVTLAIDDLPRQLRRWRTIHDHGRDLGRIVESLDLSLSTSIPARWIEPESRPSRSDFDRLPGDVYRPYPWRNRNV